MITILEDMKTYIGFGDRDAKNLAALGEIVAPKVPAVVDRFYAEIFAHPGARRILRGGNAQLERLRHQLETWLKTLFCGRYDEEYAERRAAIGEAHVRVGLPQHYMFTAIEIVRQELLRIVREAGVPDAAEKLESLQRLLVLETGLMLESYKVSYTERVRGLEQAALEQRLSRAEHLAEIGQLAASLAHEIKNPLAGISGAIQVMRDELDGDNRHRSILDEILRHIDRLDGTVKDLLTYARPQAPVFKPCDLSAIITRVGKLLGREPAFQHIHVECAACGTPAPIEADAHQIEQLLVNLLLNAAHASRPGDAVWVHMSVDDDEVTLIVEDHGEGMDEQTRKRAFEPFYTTKARGTGLGLPICRRIVETHGGSICLQDMPGPGTSVEVRLPRRAPVAAGRASR